MLKNEQPPFTQEYLFVYRSSRKEKRIEERPVGDSTLLRLLIPDR